MALFGQQTTVDGRRLHDIDWLRVVATAAVFCLHCSRFFDYGAWHVKDAATSPFFESLSVSLTLWVMPLFFAISGISAGLAIQQRGSAQFLWERISRLLPPLALGIVVLAPLQVYLERLAGARLGGSFLAFFPRYLDGLGGRDGSLAFMGTHLWYLVALLGFSLLLTPLSLPLARRTGRAMHQGLVSLCCRPPALLALALPLMALDLALPQGGVGARQFGGWTMPHYLLLFLYGCLLLGEERVRLAMRQVGPYAVMLLLLALPAAVSGRTPDGAAIAGRLCAALSTFTSWCAVLSLFYLGQVLCQGDSPALHWTAQAVMPVYMLHQTVILAVGYYVVRTPFGVGAKYVAICLLSAAIIAGLYELTIRRVHLLRLLFGMKPPAAEIAPAAAVAAPAA